MPNRFRQPGSICALVWGGLFAGACLCAVGAVGVAQEDNYQRVSRNSKDRSSKEKSKIREGARLVDKEGRISERGGRYFFAPDGESEPFTLLENQTLERVASASSNQDVEQKWSISAQVTEFHGMKFLLLERAVLRPHKAVGARNE